MIKFFRRIRQQVLFENRFSKYLIYAIGEIILVVIGILLALQINNWNENRKQNELQKTYLEDLKNDLSIDVETLSHMISMNEEKLNNVQNILTIITSKDQFTQENKVLLHQLLGTLFTENYFIPEKGTINQIEASSSGNIIKNKQLRDSIFRYYSERERVEKNMEQSLQIYQHNYITPSLLSLGIDPSVSESFFGKKYDVPIIKKSEVLNNKEYLGALSLKFGTTKNQNITYRRSKNKALKILAMITTELNHD